jgi:O-antigen/teichoic acid export membrane protein
MKDNRLQWGTSADAILLMLIRLVTIVLGFVITRLLSQYLSVYDYGTYSQIMLVVSTVNTITILGMIDGVNYFYCSEKDEEKRESYVSTIFALQCIVNVIAGSAVMLLSEQICTHFDNPDVGGLLIFSATLPLLINLVSMLQVLLVSVGKARMLAIRNLLVSLIRLGAALAVVTLVQNVLVVLLTTLVMDLAQIAFFAVILKKNHCPIRLNRIDFRLVKTIFRYCAPMGVFTAVSALNRDIDKYLIAMMTDTETLAVYSNASKVLPFDIVMSSFCTVLIPAITRNIAADHREKAAQLYKLFLEIAYISTTILCCAALSVAPQLMQLLYSSKYTVGLNIFCIYILVDLIRFSNMTLILSAAGKTRTIMRLGMASIGMNAVLNVLFYHQIGMSGPALATFLSVLITGVLMLYFGSRELGTRLWKLFDGKYLAVFTLENLAAVTVFSALRNHLASVGMHYFPVLVIVGGGYGLLMLLLHGKRLLRSLKNVNKVTGSN